ncbi:uncharacterized protein LOC135936695 [Cloeon dipterum]|uniref:uncharacterized protein LOC135936695 n=1 Tax=Cloeon dipterum TaxID=197152 RepID=UPI00321F87D1
MRLVSIQSFEKLMCLESVVPNEELEFWTSGTDDYCANRRYRWCSAEFKDFVKLSVNLNSTYSGKEVPQRCVKAKNSKAEGVRLSVDDCEIKLYALCEARLPAESHLQEVFNECKLTHRVWQREIDKLRSMNLDSSSFKMKCLLTCMAELLGFLYEGGKFWVENVERAIKKIKSPGASEDFRSIVKKYSSSSLKKEAAGRMMLREKSKQEAWKSTLHVNQALDRFEECNKRDNLSNQKGKCSFIHDFIKCLTNGSASFLDQFWNLNLNNAFGPKDFSYSMKFSLLAYNYYKKTNIPYDGVLLDDNIRTYVEYVNKVSYTEEAVSSRCIFKYLQPKNLTWKEACMELMENFKPTPLNDVFTNKITDDKKGFPPAGAASKCAAANGTLVTVTQSTLDRMKMLHQFVKKKSLFMENKDGVLVPWNENFVLLDETFQDSKGAVRWCSTSEEVPAYMKPINQSEEMSSQYFQQFGSEEPSPVRVSHNDYFDKAKVPIFFCKFDHSFLTLCKQINF